jgi:mevalonate kinase
MPNEIKVKGYVYREAQLQELLQQYESVSGQIINMLSAAHKAALGKNFGQSNALLDKLNKVLSPAALDSLKELNNTMEAVTAFESKSN